MKQINKYIWGHLENPKFSIVERLHINKDIESNYYNYHPKTNVELYELVDKLIKERGKDADLNDIDTSSITDMHYIFYNSKFNGDISRWDVSNVQNMNTMFAYSKFTGDISKWDVSNVKDMSYMFTYSKFNGDISSWDVSNVESMDTMFYRSEFTGENGDISKWDVRNVKNMGSMFYKSPLEKNPPKWYKKII